MPTEPFPIWQLLHCHFLEIEDKHPGSLIVLDENKSLSSIYNPNQITVTRSTCHSEIKQPIHTRKLHDILFQPSAFGTPAPVMTPEMECTAGPRHCHDTEVPVTLAPHD